MTHACGAICKLIWDDMWLLCCVEWIDMFVIWYIEGMTHDMLCDCYDIWHACDLRTTCAPSTTRNKPINPRPNPSSTQNPIINLVAQTHLWPSLRPKPNGAPVADNLQANQNREPNKNFDPRLDSRCLHCCVQLRCASNPSTWVDWTA